ncbi:MAG: hypothetical protein NC131_12765 [Roseburia sp.]|nr:hypothetical protein [Roseburia sp.]
MARDSALFCGFGIADTDVGTPERFEGAADLLGGELLVDRREGGEVELALAIDREQESYFDYFVHSENIIYFWQILRLTDFWKRVKETARKKENAP